LVLMIPVLGFPFGGSVSAGEFEDAVAAYDQGDYDTAFRLMKPLAEQGAADAQFNLGLFYAKGEGVPQSYAEAVKWYSKAAEQGFVRAQHNLGTMYGEGEGVTQDYVLAHMWFNIAASQSVKAEDRELAVKNRDLTAAIMTPAQIAEAQKLAREWKPMAQDK
jgi:TPR repeat protein